MALGSGGEERANPMGTMLLRMHQIRKRFGGVYALRGVDFDLRAGEVHALLGENGAGKSTLMGILSGAVTPDQGDIAIDGAPVRFASPREAQAAGIAMIPQELDLIPGLDIAANLFLGHEKLTPLGPCSTAAPCCARRGSGCGRRAWPWTPRGRSRSCASASASWWRSRRRCRSAARILVMDEPTAALSAAEAEHLFGVVRGAERARRRRDLHLASPGGGGSRRRPCHRAARRPRWWAKPAPTRHRPSWCACWWGDASRSCFRPAHAAWGRSCCGSTTRASSRAPDAPRLARPEDVSLVVHGGEIVGLAGTDGGGADRAVVGSVRRWSARAVDRADQHFPGGPRSLARSPAREARASALVTDDRRGSGLVLGQSVGWNIVCPRCAASRHSG